ncbi:MAG: hypothetical protein GY705_24040 [Bacteroidetes bacterium]|nr:hypothetical protein [Bacteroidota bacterium]
MKKLNEKIECSYCGSDDLCIDKLNVQRFSKSKGVKTLYSYLCNTCSSINIGGVAEDTPEARNEIKRVLNSMSHELDILHNEHPR